MKRFINLVFVAAIVLTGCLKAQPQLQIIGGDTYDWGTVKPSDNPLKAKVVLKNTGTEILTISEVKPGCGCTTAPISKSEITPGDTASLSVTLNVGSSVDISKSIRISSNDAKNPTKHLYLKAKVFYPIEIKPQNYFTFHDMQIGMKQESKLTLKNNTNESITLSEFVTNPPNLQLNIIGKKILKPGESFELVAIATPDKAGSFNCSVKFKTNNSEMKDVSLSGWGSVKESIMNDASTQKPKDNNGTINIQATPKK